MCPKITHKLIFQKKVKYAFEDGAKELLFFMSMLNLSHDWMKYFYFNFF